MKAKKKVNPTKRNYFFDIALAGLIGLVFVTGDELVTLHEILAVVFGGGIILHLVWHWRWLTATTRRFFGKLPRQQRINYLLNGLMLLSFLLTMASGVAISSFVGGPGGELVKDLHEASTGLFGFTVFAHVALHWRWILNMSKRHLVGLFTDKRAAPARPVPAGRNPKAPVRRPVPASN